MVLLAFGGPVTGADAPQGRVGQADVIVYGATPGGIAATVTAARAERRVILVEPTDRIGGMTTCGLSHTDIYSFESLSGVSRIRATGRCTLHPGSRPGLAAGTLAFMAHSANRK